jgi:hypothetical protein
MRLQGDRMQSSEHGIDVFDSISSEGYIPIVVGSR